MLTALGGFSKTNLGNQEFKLMETNATPQIRNVGNIAKESSLLDHFCFCNTTKNVTKARIISAENIEKLRNNTVFHSVTDAGEKKRGNNGMAICKMLIPF